MIAVTTRNRMTLPGGGQAVEAGLVLLVDDRGDHVAREAGAARVIAQMRSNERSPPMSDRMMTVAVAGRTSGSVMLRKIFQRAGAVDPGGLEVLLRDRDDAGDEDERRDADALPDVDERRPRRAPGSGRSASSGPWMPNDASVLLMRPSNGSISTLKVMPMPIVDTRTGKKIDARR